MEDTWFYESQGCWHRKIGYKGDGFRYIGDTSWADARHLADTSLRTKAVTTIHQYERGDLVEKDPKALTVTDCGGGEKHTIGIGGWGLNLTHEALVCKAYIDPRTTRNPTGRYLNRFETAWRSDNNGRTGTQFTHQMDMLLMDPDNVPSGFIYNYKVESGVDGCTWSCWILTGF